MSTKKIIVLVEDDPDHADLITDILEGKCQERDIMLVRDGKAAVDYFQEFSDKSNGQIIKDLIKLILIDLNLPKICGMDVIRYLKRNPKYSQVPVVVLSTSSDQGTIEEAYANGVSDFVTKPVSYEEFITKLEGMRKYY